MDLIVRHARLLGSEESGLFDISVNKGQIVSITRSSTNYLDGAKKIDAVENLVLPSFVEPHVHLDKVLLAEQVKEASSIVEARELVRDAKKHFTVENVTERVEKVIPWAIQGGITAIRTHVDVDSIARLVSVEALVSLRKKYEKSIDIQIVAFPQEGLIKDPSALDLVRKALEVGANVVGGLPEAESSIEDSRKHTDLAIQMSKEADKDVDMHCDVLPSSRFIEYYANKILSEGMEGRATADHLIALSYYDDEEALQTINLIKRAMINVVSNPCTSINSGSSNSPPLGRGVTRIREMVRAGINLAYGIDNIVDPYNPFGDFDPLSNGLLFAYLGQLNTKSDFETVLRMPTYNSASILRLNSYGLRPGDRASFNILNAANAREALRTHQRPRFVIKNGKVILENTIVTARDS